MPDWWAYSTKNTNYGFYRMGWPQKGLHWLLWLALFPLGPLIRWILRREEE